MSKTVILSKDVHAIDMQTYGCKNELEEMQGWLNWFNSLPYVEPLTNLSEIKKFFGSTKEFHDAKAVEYLKIKVQELPPNLAPLKEMYNITECDDENFAKKYSEHFNFLELNDGILAYSQKLYNEIETKNTLEATPEQAKTLKKLSATYGNCMRLCELLSPSNTHLNIHKEVFNQAFAIILKQKQFGTTKQDANLTLFDFNKLNLLTEKNF